MDDITVTGRNRHGQKIFAQPCIRCGKPAWATLQTRKRGHGKYCSHTCASTALRPAGTVNMPPKERFWSKVDKNGPVPAHRPELGPCWVWTGPRTKKGYGYIGIGGRSGRKHLAHRVSYCWAQGMELTALGERCVLHECDGGSIGCVRPEHLSVGTRIENNIDMRARNRGTKPPRRCGTSNNKAKLTDEDVRSVRRRYAGGEPVSAIAESLDVNKTTVYGILNGKNWKHVA